MRSSNHPSHPPAAIRYLEHCVFTLHNNDRSIHNFLISVYAKSSASQDHRKLLDYLVIQSREVYTHVYI